MPSPFASLSRSIEADRHRLSLLALGVGMGLLGLWVGWFLLARVPVSVVGPEARWEVGEVGPVVVAELPAAEALRVREGLEAWFHLHGLTGADSGAVPARVKRVADEVRDGKLRVECVPAGTVLPLRPGMTGTLEIEVERASPAALVLRAAGAGPALTAGGVR